LSSFFKLFSIESAFGERNRQTKLGQITRDGTMIPPIFSEKGVFCDAIHSAFSRTNHFKKRQEMTKNIYFNFFLPFAITACES
jgi:hypothetical protein